jgi:hypothetical protein
VFLDAWPGRNRLTHRERNFSRDVVFDENTMFANVQDPVQRQSELATDMGLDTLEMDCSQDLEIYPWEMQNLDPIAEGESKLQHPVQMS